MLYMLDDVPEWNPTLKRLTKEQLAIPNLYMMGHANIRSSTIKLQNHYHHTMEITVFLKGTQQYYVNDTRYDVRGGDIFMTRPQECHGNSGYYQEVCEYVWFQFDLNPSSDSFLGLLQPYGDYLYQQLLHYNLRIKKAKAEDVLNLRQAFFLIASPLPHQKMAGYNLFLQFVINNLGTPELTADHDGHSPEIQSAISFIHTHLYEDISIDTIANSVGLSPSRFKVRFKNEIGNPPHSYITLQRIQIAKSLLLDRNQTITSIAHRLNFSSSHHFSSVFKKYTGYTPSEFRENNS